jgi:hypothetical protein
LNNFKKIFEEQNFNTYDFILPTDILNKTISNNEFKKIYNFATIVENNPHLIKNFTGYNKKLLNEILIIKLNESNFNYIEKGKILNELLKEKILDNSYSNLLNEYLISAKKENIFENNNNLNENGIKQWIQNSINDIKKILNGFKTAMGAFGKALIGFFKGFNDFEMQQAIKLLKNKKFVSLAKYIGNWLLERFTDSATLYHEMQKILENSVFKSISHTNVVEWLKNFLKKHVQDNIDKLTNYSTGNQKIIKIINDKYNGDKDEALLDREVLKLILQDKGVAKSGAILILKMGLGSYLAYLSWEIWNTMVFKGDLIYDYNFSGAIDAIKGKYDLSEWFFSDSGTETLIWYFLGALGMPSIAPESKMAQITLAIVVTVIVIWIKKHPNEWKNFLDSKFVKKIMEIYENSKKRIILKSEEVLNKVKDKILLIKQMATKTKILRPSSIKI